MRPVSHVGRAASVQLHVNMVTWDYGPVLLYFLTIQKKFINQIFRFNFQDFKLRVQTFLKLGVGQIEHICGLVSA